MAKNYSVLKMPQIPDRWIPYSPHGDIIEGTRFVCFKVPLRKTVQDCLYENKTINEIWDINEVVHKLPNLGLVIDLTNTAKYYSPHEFEAKGVRHVKILIPGREIPPEKSVREFGNIVDDFLENTTDKLIGVHCTHGLNRTGYMVCKYMVDRMGVQPDTAIERFEKARGYQIERENYLADIRKRENIPPPDFSKKTLPKRSSRPERKDFSRDRSSRANNESERWRDRSSEKTNRFFKYDYRYHY